MFDDRNLVLQRIARFVIERVEPNLHRGNTPLEATAWVAPGEPVPFAEATANEFVPFEIGTAWGRPWGTTWFHVTGTVPEDFAGDGVRPEVLVNLGFNLGQAGFQAEGLVYDTEGRTVKAIEPFNSWIPVGEPGSAIDYYIEAASNPDVGGFWTHEPTVMGDWDTAPVDPLYHLTQLDIALLDTEVWELDRDIWTLRGLMGQLPKETMRAADILRALERMIDAIDPHDVPGTAAAGRAELAAELAKPASDSALRVVGVGHAHIDSAWLWPLRETVRKCARTFTNVLDLMDGDDTLVFACSSAQQFAWMKEFYPELFDRIRGRVADGRFVPVGGMWVESDTNLPGGEALARQFVEGKNFFLEEFGVETTEVWLPDSFGYSGALPQIVRASASDYFLTQKLSWNETNVMPHSTFEWQGIDGTRVFTHFPPANTYNSNLSAEELARSEKNYREKGRANYALLPFGFGDGGGGPTREMLAQAKRTASLEGSPKVSVESPRAFFDAARADYPAPPVWTGELYLEFHRGTYTSQARTKVGNRRSESLLREAELWCATATRRTGAPYPYEKLREVWRTVLLLQFHDILPGSSIAWVYRDADRKYREVWEVLDGVIADALRALGAEPADEGGSAFNAGPFEVDGVPALGAGPVAGAETAASVSVSELPDGIAFTSDDLRIELDSAGRVRSFVDAGRELVAPGAVAAELQLFRDTPNQWDAWDIDAHYRRHESALTQVDAMTVTDSGPDRVAVLVERTFGDSSLRQEFSLVAGSRSLDISTSVDWHEKQTLMKLAFPLDVTADRSASEIQFGHIFRPTVENTSWDSARFEISGHRWVHVAEPGFGAAVGNNATYGRDVTKQPREGGGSITLVRESLLRAPLFPDPGADQGEHTFRTSLRVAPTVGDAVREGYRVNLPLRHATGGDVAPLVTVDGEGVTIESVKLAEDRSGDLVLRIYEALGARSSAILTIDRSDGTGVEETDLLERAVEPTGSVERTGSGVTLTLRPFQLLTLRVRGA